MIQIIVVDDERDIREILQYNLELAGYSVVCAQSAEEALARITPECALILLDIMMSGMSGYEMAERLRSEQGNEVPIIFLTAKGEERDMLRGFSAGGDDYIVKPFSVQEVLARVSAVLRRTEARKTPPSPSPNQTKVPFCVDSERKLVMVDRRQIRLTPKDLGIVSLLAAHRGRIFSRREILDDVWGGESQVLERTVDVHIAHIRHQLGKWGSLIVGHQGYGYSMEDV